MLTLEELRQLHGRTMIGAGGEDLGTIQDLYADRTDDDGTFATVVDTAGGLACVPLAEAELRGDDVLVPYDDALVSSAPWIGEGTELTPEEEDQLYAHYGLERAAAVVEVPEPTPSSIAYGTAGATITPATRSGGSRRQGVTSDQSASATEQVAGAAQEAAAETASTAKDEAAQTARAATSAAADVAGTAKEQVGQVAGEAVDQVRQLAGQARGQLVEQADGATQRLGDTLRTLSGEVRDLSEGRSDGSGTVAGLAAQLADTGERLADHVSRQGPAGLVQDLRSFATRRPGAFLLGALAAGVVTGRLVKGATSDAADERSASSPGRTTGTPARPAPSPVVVLDDADPYDDAYDDGELGPVAGDQRSAGRSPSPYRPSPGRR